MRPVFSCLQIITMTFFVLQPKYKLEQTRIENKMFDMLAYIFYYIWTIVQGLNHLIC